MQNKINWTSVSALVFYPVFLIVLGILYGNNYGLGSFEIILLVVGYYGSNISVGVGLHRLWSHNAFKTNKFVEFVLMLFASGTLQGPILSWASNHYKHHTFTDEEQDPHTPLKFQNRVLGFLWSHIGWMLVGEGSYKSIDRLTMTKLGKSKLLRWQLRYYWQIATFMNTVAPALVGYLVGGDLHSAYTGFLFIGLGRALQQQATFCVNSACHFLGVQKYAVSTAGDIWWMAIFLLGENWHNYHHAFPSDYRNGAKWYQCDVHKWIIYGMSKVGLAWNLNRTPEVRVKAKVAETARLYAEDRKQKLNMLEEKIAQLTNNFYIKLNELEHSSAQIKTQLQNSFLDAQNRLKMLAEQLQNPMQFSSVSSEKFIQSLSEKLQNTEKLLCNLYNRLDTAAKAF